MDINDLKSDWQNAGSDYIDEQNLKLMTKVNQHPALKRLRLELLFYTIILTAFLAVYYDAFDGNNKPFWVNFLLVSSLLLYLINNLVGYFLIKNPVRANNIFSSVQKQVFILKRLSLTTLVASVLYSITFIAFFTVTVELNQKKYILLAVMILIFVTTRYFAFKNWLERVDHFSQLLSDFKDIS